MYSIHKKAEKMLKEPNFRLFKYNDFLCAVLRMSNGCLNGYVAVEKKHPLYGKDMFEKIKVKDINEIKFNGNLIGIIGLKEEDIKNGLLAIDMALNVHYGITYSNNCVDFIDKEIFPDLWWFGFNTSHCDDLSPIQNCDLPEITTKKYRDYNYVIKEVKKLTKELKKYE